jgi:hypothetical protein
MLLPVIYQTPPKKILFSLLALTLALLARGGEGEILVTSNRAG